MFAYCRNNPVILTDESGCLGVLGSMLAGGIFGVASQFISGVMENISEGVTGWDIFLNTGSTGEYVSAFVSGAVSSIPGANIIVSIGCDFLEPALEQGIDYVVHGEALNHVEYWDDVATNLICETISFFGSTNSPEFIRDIKDEAAALGAKGTRELESYLSFAKDRAFFENLGLGFGVSVSVDFIKAVPEAIS